MMLRKALTVSKTWFGKCFGGRNQEGEVTNAQTDLSIEQGGLAHTLFEIPWCKRNNFKLSKLMNAENLTKHSS